MFCINDKEGRAPHKFLNLAQAPSYLATLLESYSRISALGPVGQCTSHFKRAVCISCRLRPRVDVHKGGGGSGPCGPMWTEGRGLKNPIFRGRHKWMTPSVL